MDLRKPLTIKRPGDSTKSLRRGVRNETPQISAEVDISTGGHFARGCLEDIRGAEPADDAITPGNASRPSQHASAFTCSCLAAFR
jgi:hypothetical protein